MSQMSDDLLRQCTEAMHGSDFPTVWQTVLRSHRLVMGPPVQYMKAVRKPNCMCAC